MENKNTVTEEIIIVGSRYGDYADGVTPLYQRDEPIALEDIKKVLGDDEVYLMSVPNKFDPYAVGVFSVSQTFVGHVWMYQAPCVRRWLDENHKTYLPAHVTSLSTRAGVMMARTDTALDLEQVERSSMTLDERWAENLPEVLTSITEQSLALGMALLRDDLEQAESWNKRIEHRIDNLLRVLPLDLSACRYMDSIALYKTMCRSTIAEVRQQSELLLATLVHRGSRDQMTWWVEHWLPDFFRDAAEGDLLGLFKAANFTLERVEELLNRAPENLFYLYKVNKFRFANHLYYSALPQPIYNRLLTLLAVREAMVKSKRRLSGVSRELLSKAVNAVKSYFWGYSSNAVLFCVCRDYYDYPDNMSLFERELIDLEYPDGMDYKCKEGTIVNAMKKNGYMRHHVDNWESMGVLKRVLVLRDEFISVMDNCIMEE